MSIQMLVIMVPVLFGMMGFAIDLGRLYLVRGELSQAANAMALAAAAQLNGTTAANTADFGFIKDTLYTLSDQCSGGTLPINIPGTTSIGPAGLSTIPYEILNRLDPNNALLTESDQLYMSGAQGLVSSLNPTPNALTTTPNTPLACVNMGDSEQVWASAVPGMCSLPISSVEAALCGVYSRLHNQGSPAACPTAV